MFKLDKYVLKNLNQSVLQILMYIILNFLNTYTIFIDICHAHTNTCKHSCKSLKSCSFKLSIL